ncbi:MAG: hypothetical protein ACUZ8E_06825 [Candidatus Anammoxibacter sp.]
MTKAKIYKKKVDTIKNIIDGYETRNEPNEAGNYDEDITGNTIYARLKRARFKYNLNICKDAFLSIIAVSVIFLLISIIYSKFFEISPYLQIAFFSIPAIFLVFSVFTVFRDFKDKDEIVKIIDRKMGLKERLITSLEFANSSKKSRLYNTLANDAFNLLDDKHINESLNNGISKRNKIFIILVGILGIAAIFLPYHQLLDKKPSNFNMSAAANPPVVNPSHTPENAAVKEEEEDDKKPNEITANKQEQKDTNEESTIKDNKPKVVQSEEEKIEKDINDIMKRILSLLNNYSESDDLEIDGDNKDSQSSKLAAQTDQSREQENKGSVSKNGDLDNKTKQEPETGKTDASKDDSRQGQKTANNLTTQKQQDNNKSNQSANSGSSQDNTNSNGTDGTGTSKGGSSQTATNTKGSTNRQKQRSDTSNSGSPEIGSGGGKRVASAGNITTDSSTGRTSRNSQPGKDKRGNNGDKSGQNGGTEDKKQVASGKGNAGKGHEDSENKIGGQDKNQSQTEKDQQSVSKSDSLSGNNKSSGDSDTTKSKEEDKEVSGGLGSNDKVTKLDKDVKSGNKSGKDNSGKDGKGTGGEVDSQLDAAKASGEKENSKSSGQKITQQSINTKQKDSSNKISSSHGNSKQDKTEKPKDAKVNSTSELAKSGDSDKNNDQTEKGNNRQPGTGKPDNKNEIGDSDGLRVAQQNIDTNQKNPSDSKPESSSSNQESKADEPKTASASKQRPSNAKGSSSWKKQNKQTANKSDDTKDTGSNKTDKTGSAGTKVAQGGTQESPPGTEKDDLALSSTPDKNGDIDSIKKDIANLLSSVENKIEDYDNKEKGQQGTRKPGTELSDNVSPSDDKTSDARSNDVSNQPGTGAGNKSSNNLYSEKSENIDFGKGEEFEILIAGEQDTHDGQIRDVLLYGTKFETGEWEQPNVPIDVNAKLNRQQSKDDAIKNTQIPSEYEKIIKGIYINNNN